ncbi:CinA family nicotinamide mononucleotide deamidase-related protein [Vibrio sp. NTOU-M3]|uniref:CinA family nicotinamide mononucleotide deamidase-related protein n=1 Tax=Vibrio sp. NTOU-M3 TaxID=3234954 RepID=UPI00349F18A2
MLKIAMLSTGEEVLHGDILDTNAAWLSERFFVHGFSLIKRSTVGDAMSSLMEELLMLSFNTDVVIVNGGLGPTSDDLSAEAAANVAEQELVVFPEWRDRLEAFFAQRGVTMPESNIKQATLPKSCQILDNPIGTACGFKMHINDCLFYFTPGVPKEFKRMVDEQILPDLKNLFPHVTGEECSRLYTFGTSESALSDKLDKVELPAGYTLGYRSYLPFIEVKLFGPVNDVENRSKLMQILFNLIETHVVSVDEPMLVHLGSLIEHRKQSLAITEQSTFGWLSNWLHEDDHVATYCGHGWVLGHRVQLGNEESDHLAATFALAGATREKCATDLALVTGKVVEDTFTVALAAPEGEWGQKLQFNRTYSKKEQRLVISTVAADMLRRYLSSKPIFVRYSSLKSEKEMFVPQSVIGS